MENHHGESYSQVCIADCFMSVAPNRRCAVCPERGMVRSAISERRNTPRRKIPWIRNRTPKPRPTGADKESAGDSGEATRTHLEESLGFQTPFGETEAAKPSRSGFGHDFLLISQGDDITWQITVCGVRVGQVLARSDRWFSKTPSHEMFGGRGFQRTPPNGRLNDAFKEWAYSLLPPPWRRR